jgi:outer membrane protein assembly factor BamB
MKTASILAVLSLGILSLPSARADWQQWRGPERDGTVAGKKWPANFAGLKEKWRLPLGASYSGPVTDGKHVFTTESVDKRLEKAHAVDVETGKIVWSAEWEGHQGVPFFAKRNGDWIRSTPTLAEGSLLVAGMQDVLVSLDAKTGKQQWRLDFKTEFKSEGEAFGFVCSPLVDGEFVYAHAGAGLCKIERKSGKVVWRTMDEGGGMMGGSFSSPVLATVAGKRQLLVQGRDMLCGVDPADGKELWAQKIKTFRGMNVFTPVVQGNRIFTSAYGGLSQAWDIAKEGETFKVALAWEHKAEGYMSTPVIVGGKVFMHLRNQKVTCLDLATGTQHWQSDDKLGEYWSLIAQGDRILALDHKGTLYLLKATPEKLEIIDQKKVCEEETWAHVAVDGGRVFVRDLKGLVALDWASGEAVVTEVPVGGDGR